jgi:hypothetical protein
MNEACSVVGQLLIDSFLTFWNNADHPADSALLLLLKGILALARTFGLDSLGSRFRDVIEAVNEAFYVARSYAIGELGWLEHWVGPISELYVLMCREDPDYAANLIPVLDGCLSRGNRQMKSFSMALAVRLLPVGIIGQADAEAPDRIVDAMIGFIREDSLPLATDAVVSLGELAHTQSRPPFELVTQRVGAVFDAIGGRLAVIERMSLPVMDFQDAVAFTVTQLFAAMGDRAPFDRGIPFLTHCLPLDSQRFFDPVMKSLAGMWRLLIQREALASDFVRIAAPMIAIGATRFNGVGPSVMGCACGLREALKVLPDPEQVIADALGHDEFRHHLFMIAYGQALQEYAALMEMVAQQTGTIGTSPE